MSREYPSRPLVGVGVVVVDSDRRVLLVRRGRPPGKGLWSVPGGLVRLGETLREAAVREVQEECGVEISPGQILGVVEPRVHDDRGRLRFHYVIVDLVATYCGGAALAASDADEVRWVTESDLDILEFSLPETARMICEGLSAL